MTIYQSQCLTETLKNVETVEFIGECSGIENILLLCLNIKILRIERCLKWPSQNYPTLEEIRYRLHLPDNTLSFLKNNPQLKRISLLEFATVGDFVDIFEQSEMQLDELKLCYETLIEDDVMRPIVWRDADSPNCIDNFKLINNLNTLEICYHPGTADLIEALPNMANVCKLKLDLRLILFFPNPYRITETLSRQLVNLDELS